MVPLLDLAATTAEIREELEDVYARFLSSGQYVLGSEVEAFETEYASYCESNYCIGVSSGLDALHLALRAAGIGRNDEVIVASNTYIATWLAVTHTGATVVPVEPDPATHNIDPDLIAEKITHRTKAVLATNLYGLPVDYNEIHTICEAADIRFVVDNAQASGAKYRNRAVGGLASLECHSFYPSKNLGALGEAGAVTTCDQKLANQIRLLRNYGSRERYYHEAAGFNNRLDELQAGILRVKLRHLDKWNTRRKAVVSLYESDLQNVTGIILPRTRPYAESAWHQYVIRVTDRDRRLEQLNDAGIGCLVHYPIPPHRSGVYESMFSANQFPIANELANSVLSIPMGPHLSSSDAKLVAATLKRIVRQSNPEGGSAESRNAA